MKIIKTVRSYKRKVLDVEMSINLLDIYEFDAEGEAVVVDISRVLWIIPMLNDKQME